MTTLWLGLIDRLEAGSSCQIHALVAELSPVSFTNHSAIESYARSAETSSLLVLVFSRYCRLPLRNADLSRSTRTIQSNRFGAFATAGKGR